MAKESPGLQGSVGNADPGRAGQEKTPGLREAMQKIARSSRAGLARSRSITLAPFGKRS